MAQSFAAPLYHSGAWKKNQKNYMRALVDTSGEIVVQDEVDGRFVYRRRDDMTPVPDSLVVPPGMCERCFRMGQLNPAKLVHHKIHLTPQNVDDPHITLAYDNLMRLCQDCHAYVHSGMQESRVTFDDNGNVVPKRESLAEMVERLTSTVDERRNIHKEEKAW